MSRFEDLGLIEPLLRAVKEEGYDVPTPIQQRTIKPVAEGKTRETEGPLKRALGAREVDA